MPTMDRPPTQPDARRPGEPLVLPLPAGALVVLVGAAGSGKSTFAARHFAPDEVLSSDALRAAISGDPGNQRATPAAFRALHRALDRRLAHGLLTVVDATNVQGHARRALVARARAAGAAAIAIVLDLPEEVVLARNAARHGSELVPEPAVREQLARLAASLAGDLWSGFARIVRLGTPEEVDRVRIERLPPAGGGSSEDRSGSRRVHEDLSGGGEHEGRAEPSAG